MKKLCSLTMVAALLGSGLAFSQNPEGKGKGKGKGGNDPFVLDPNANVVDEEHENAPRSIGILVEFIQTDHRMANKLIRKHAAKAADASELRDELEKLIDDGSAELIETSWIHARSGQRAKTESIDEKIYPTEWDPAEIPNTVGGVAPATAAKPEGQAAENRKAAEKNAKSGMLMGEGIHMTNPNPTAFEVRNVGTTLEVDPVLGPDNKTIDLNLAPEIVQYLGENYIAREGFEETARGLEHFSNPQFYTMKATSAVTTIDGQYCLLSMLRPHEDKDARIFLLVRADVIVVK